MNTIKKACEDLAKEARSRDWQARRVLPGQQKGSVEIFAEGMEFNVSVSENAGSPEFAFPYQRVRNRMLVAVGPVSSRTAKDSAGEIQQLVDERNHNVEAVEKAAKHGGWEVTKSERPRAANSGPGLEEPQSYDVQLDCTKHGRKKLIVAVAHVDQFEVVEDSAPKYPPDYNPQVSGQNKEWTRPQVESQFT